MISVVKHFFKKTNETIIPVFLLFSVTDNGQVLLVILGLATRKTVYNAKMVHVLTIALTIK